MADGRDRMQRREAVLAARLGAAIRTARLARRWSQDALAERLDISKNHLSYLERGERLPSVGMLADIAQELDLDLNVLKEGEKENASDLEALALVRQVAPALREFTIEILRAAVRQGEKPGRARRRQ